MILWNERAHEERNLLNPAFCSILLWHAGEGSTENSNSPRASLSYIESFLVLPLILHQGTRDSLPSRTNSSLPVWVNDNPLVIANLPNRARALVSHTKEAIIFGGTGGLFRIEEGQLLTSAEQMSAIRTIMRDTSVEVQQCMRKARFLGKWFTHTGSPETIFTLLGVRP